jgi:uncharacterized protein
MIRADPGGTGVLSPIAPAECLSLMATRPVGRLAFTRSALPDIIPVNFVLHERTVLIRLDEDSSVARAVQDAVVAFEVDDLDVEDRSGWSVTVIGPARRWSGAGTGASGEVAGLRSWAAGARNLVMAIGTERVSGRRLRA